MKAYKLTRVNNQALNQTQWGPNVTHTATGPLDELVEHNWIRYYSDPILAVLLNPIHADFKRPHLWECETAGKHKHKLLKSGCKTLTTVKRMRLPKITPIQQAAFAILCAKKVCKDEKWNNWADNWLSGEDRSFDAVSSAQIAASYADRAADTYASYAAKIAATTGCVAGRFDADAAGYAAEYAYNVDPTINFVALANKAMTYAD